MYKFIFLFLTVFTMVDAFSQNAARFTVSGHLRDSLNTESLISATIHNRATLAGTTTNQFGFYSLTLPAGEVEIVYSYVGYNTQTLRFNLRRDTVINVSLSGATHLQELEVTAARTSRIQETTQMSAISVPMVQVKSLPAFLGEVDLLKTLQLMPGVQSGGEGSSGLYVRGGGPDQNLILLDGVPIYNVSHLFGFFSVFNADAVNSMELIKGGFPARYGGRTSSVLDINLKEGNMQKFGGEGAIGIVSAKLTLEGPIVKDRASFIVSGRRTYIDVLAAPFIAMMNNRTNNNVDYEGRGTSETINPGYYFYDLTAKVNYRISPKNRIFLSAYMGDDKLRIRMNSTTRIGGDYDWFDPLTGTNIHSFSDYSREYINDYGIMWGNVTTAFRWNHIFTNKLFSNTTLTYSRYRYNLFSLYEHRINSIFRETVTRPGEPPVTEEGGISDNIFHEMQYRSSIYDLGAKIAFDYVPSPAHYIRFGGGATHHTFTPGVLALRDTVQRRNIGETRHYAKEYAVYAEDDIRLTQRLRANIGLHWSAFHVDGELYNFLQPRIATRYLITSQLSAKASYARMAQYVHLLTNTNVGLPTDLWVPSTPNLLPQTSDQIAAGVAQNFRDNYEITIEAYYKTMNNVMEYKEGTSFFELGDDAWEKKITQGKGRSYGIELFAQKKTGAFTGWFGYTLSWTDRLFDDLNRGQRFPYKYDRRHDLSIALMQRFGKARKHEISAVWVFGSGASMTVPIAIYDAHHPIGTGTAATENGGDTWRSSDSQYGDITRMNNPYFEYGDRNAYRMAPYHRLDVSVAFVKDKKWGERRWIFGVYNAYSRMNPFYVDVREMYEYEVRNVRQFKFVQISLFPIIPSISYQFSF